MSDPSHSPAKTPKNAIFDNTIGGNLTLLDAGYIWRYYYVLPRNWLVLMLVMRCSWWIGIIPDPYSERPAKYTVCEQSREQFIQMGWAGHDPREGKGDLRLGEVYGSRN
jgi:hypothetical protein